MPTYQYVCAANGVTVEVKHRMSESPGTWGELCSTAGMAPDGTPPESPVAKMLTATFVAGGAKGGDTAPAPGGGHRHSGLCRH